MVLRVLRVFWCAVLCCVDAWNLLEKGSYVLVEHDNSFPIAPAIWLLMSPIFALRYLCKLTAEVPNVRSP